MEFERLRTEAEKLASIFARERGLAHEKIRTVASPYRICPLGAHIDHQGGPVLGMTINAYTILAYVPTEDGTISLRSLNYPGNVGFHLDRIPENTGSFWGVYARGIVLALQEAHPLKRGITGLIKGYLPGGGLSSSASILLAYLSALSEANDLQPTPWDFVSLVQCAENTHIGLNNGILDQASIVFGLKDHLLHIDTQGRSVSSYKATETHDNYRVLIAYSGYSRELTTTGYNSRVNECRKAARLLSEFDMGPPVDKLGDISERVFQRHGKRLPQNLSRRATHFFTEAARVREGLDAWRSGRFDIFGRLIFESCRSSIEQYECGSQAIHDLQQIVSQTEGIVGSRFNGGGFGGCVVGFVKASKGEEAAHNIRIAYRKRHPEAADQAAVYLAKSEIDETDEPQSPEELLLILAAIAAEDLPVQTIAPKFSGRFNKGVDFVGNISRFNEEFDTDVCVIKYGVLEFGLPQNLKLSIHSGSDKFSIYPGIYRATNKHDAGLHLKTAGTTWLEELMGLAESGEEALQIAKRVYTRSLGRMDELCRPYATVIDIDTAKLPSKAEVSAWGGKKFIETLRHDPSSAAYNQNFRQLLHVGYKIAAEMGSEFTDSLKKNERIIAPLVTQNLYERHIKPVFLGSR